MIRIAVAALALLSASARADEGTGSQGMGSETSWDACPSEADTGRYFLGRFANGTAVVEVGRSSTPAIAKLWAHAKPGGTPVNWPGGRPGVRHLDGVKAFADLIPAADAGRLYTWEAINGWGGNLATITGMELAKSLCDAKTLVIYAVLKFEEPGEGFAVASVLPPMSDDPNPVAASPAPDVVNRLYASALELLHTGLRAQRLVPAHLEMSVLPGHFTERDLLQYAISLKWSNGFDDKFSLVALADQTGKINEIVDRQEGGAGGIAVEVAPLEGSPQDLIYQLSTMDGSSAALWSLKGGKLQAVVQTTPVGE